MSYMTFSSQEKPLFQKRIPLCHLFFTLFVLSRASDNTNSQNIGGPMHGLSPHLKFSRERPPSPPRSPPLIPRTFLTRLCIYSLIAYENCFLCYVITCTAPLSQHAIQRHSQCDRPKKRKVFRQRK